MALQSSGQITLAEVRNEFFGNTGTTQFAMSSLYGKGNAPASSGEIQLAQDFYGTSSNLAQFTITCGKRTIKSTGGGNFDFGLVIPGASGTGASSGFGSLTSAAGSNAFANRTCVKVVINQDFALTNQMKLLIAFNGTTNADSIWTSVKVHNIQRNRVNFSTTTINSTAFQYSIVLGAANTTNPLPENSSRTITFF